MRIHRNVNQSLWAVPQQGSTPCHGFWNWSWPPLKKKGDKIIYTAKRELNFDYVQCYEYYEKDLENDDILVFKDGYWVNVRKEEYIADVRKDIKDFKNEISNFKKENDELKEKINNKLEQYHRILQSLTKEN